MQIKDLIDLLSKRFPQNYEIASEISVDDLTILPFSILSKERQQANCNHKWEKVDERHDFGITTKLFHCDSCDAEKEEIHKQGDSK